MTKIKIFIHRKLIAKLNNLNKQFVVFGLSNTVKDMIAKYPEIQNKIKFIADNNYKQLTSNYNNIAIVSPSRIDKNDLVILCGNHVFYQLKQLKKINVKKIYIDFDTSKQNILNPKTKIIIETPNKTSNHQDTNHQFSKILIKYLQNFYTQLLIKPIQFNLQYHKNKRNIKKNELIFSYHSIGETMKSVIRWKEGYLSDMVAFDTKGYSGWSSLCDENIPKIISKINIQKAEEFFDKFSKDYINSNSSKYLQADIKDITFPKKFIFFPIQTINDSVMEHSYFNPLELIEYIILLLEQKQVPLVIKKHPRCHSVELENLLQKYKNRYIAFNGSIHDAISKASTIYTINSGVGFESLMHLKPVVTFGKSDYMSMTKNVTCLKEIKINPFYDLTQDEKQAIKLFIYYYLKEKSLFINDKIQIQKFIDKIILNYVIRENNV